MNQWNFTITYNYRSMLYVPVQINHGVWEINRMISSWNIGTSLIFQEAQDILHEYIKKNLNILWNFHWTAPVSVEYIGENL